MVRGISSEKNFLETSFGWELQSTKIIEKSDGCESIQLNYEKKLSSVQRVRSATAAIFSVAAVVPCFISMEKIRKKVQKAYTGIHKKSIIIGGSKKVIPPKEVVHRQDVFLPKKTVCRREIFLPKKIVYCEEVFIPKEIVYREEVFIPKETVYRSEIAHPEKIVNSVKMVRFSHAEVRIYDTTAKKGLGLCASSYLKVLKS